LLPLAAVDREEGSAATKAILRCRILLLVLLPRAIILRWLIAVVIAAFAPVFEFVREEEREAPATAVVLGIIVIISIITSCENASTVTRKLTIFPD